MVGGDGVGRGVGAGGGVVVNVIGGRGGACATVVGVSQIRFRRGGFCSTGFPTVVFRFGIARNNTSSSAWVHAITGSPPMWGLLHGPPWSDGTVRYDRPVQDSTLMVTGPPSGVTIRCNCGAVGEFGEFCIVRVGGCGG